MVGNSVDRFNGLVSSLAIKSPCVVASDVNLVLDGVQTVNGVAVVSGDRVLVKDQTNPVENGIYDVTSSTWNRSADFDGNRDVTLNTIVLAGVNASEPVVYRVTSALPIIIGTTAINWAQGIRGAGTINVVEDLTPQLGGNLLSNTFDIDMLDNDYVNFGTNSDVVMGFNGVTFNVDYLPTGGTWNITGFDSIDVGASAINNVDSLRITESTVPLGYTVSADAGSRGLRFVGDDPWNTEWYAIFDCGYGVAIVANANGSTMAGAVPTVGDTLYATLDIWAPANDLYAAQFGFNGEDSLQVGNWVVDGDIYFYITRAGNLHEYSLWLDAVNQAVTVQDWSFRISNGGNYIARGTEYVDFKHDGTDLNIAGVNTTGINITGVANVDMSVSAVSVDSLVLENTAKTFAGQFSADDGGWFRFDGDVANGGYGMYFYDCPALGLYNTNVNVETSPATLASTPYCEFTMYQRDDTGLMSFGFLDSPVLYLLNYIRGASIELAVYPPISGGQQTGIKYTGGGAAELSYNGTPVARTLTAANGGCEANNTLTGTGFERVLTESDASITSTTAALAAVANAINTSARKEAGFMVFNTTTNKPVWAVGNADASVWVDATGATAHTPI